MSICGIIASIFAIIGVVSIAIGKADIDSYIFHNTPMVDRPILPYIILCSLICGVIFSTIAMMGT